MVRKLLKVSAVVVVCFAGLLFGVSAYAGRKVDAPYPKLVADTTPHGLSRGAAIFHAMCESCHRPEGGARASGAQMKEVPALLGTLYSANLTRDAVAGIGARTDAELARVIRFGVTWDNRMSVMGSPMADEDIAAVIGFMRSDDPLFEADPTPAKKVELSMIGKVILLVSGASSVPDRLPEGIRVPPRSDKLAYGRYLANDLYDCVGCHTPSYDKDKAARKDAFQGGFEFPDGKGGTVTSSNLRFEPGGLGGWTKEDLAHAVRDGVKRDGTAPRFPMPRFAGLADDEVDALYVYLRAIGPDGQPDPSRVQELAVNGRGTPAASSPSTF